MTKKTQKPKDEGKIINDPKELPIDVIGQSEGSKDTTFIKTLEAQSNVKLEDDKGYGDPIKLFFYDFKGNPEVFSKQLPTAQELFNSHLKQIEIHLWENGWKPYTDAQPRFLISKSQQFYRFIIPAQPARGTIVKEKPLTLKEIAHERK